MGNYGTSTDTILTIPHPKEVADSLGLEMVEPSVQELMLDIDSTADDAHFAEMLVFPGKNYQGTITVTKITKSKSDNKHVYIELDRGLSVIERIAFQACMGSDRKREMWSLMKALFKPEQPPTVLFEVPQPKVEKKQNNA